MRETCVLPYLCIQKMCVTASELRITASGLRVTSSGLRETDAETGAKSLL